MFQAAADLNVDVAADVAPEAAVLLRDLRVAQQHHVVAPRPPDPHLPGYLAHQKTPNSPRNLGSGLL